MKGFIWKIGMVATAIATIIPSGLAYGESDQSKRMFKNTDICN
jgi:hypothetical protein